MKEGMSEIGQNAKNSTWAQPALHPIADVKVDIRFGR